MPIMPRNCPDVFEDFVPAVQDIVIGEAEGEPLSDGRFAVAGAVVLVGLAVGVVLAAIAFDDEVG